MEKLRKKSFTCTPRHLTFIDAQGDCHSRITLDFPCSEVFGTTERLQYAEGSIGLDKKGLWRCGGCLQNTDIPYPTKYPVLLPLTNLVVQDARVRIGHNRAKESLTEVQSRYWIMKGQSLTRAIVHKCTNCKNYEGAPFDGPPPLCQSSGSRMTQPSPI